jgi:hypothetical protein
MKNENKTNGILGIIISSLFIIVTLSSCICMALLQKGYAGAIIFAILCGVGISMLLGSIVILVDAIKKSKNNNESSKVATTKISTNQGEVRFEIDPLNFGIAPTKVKNNNVENFKKDIALVKEEVFDKLKIREEIIKHPTGSIENKKLKDAFLNTEILSNFSAFCVPRPIKIKQVIEDVKCYNFNNLNQYLRELKNFEARQECLSTYAEKKTETKTNKDNKKK